MERTEPIWEYWLSLSTSPEPSAHLQSMIASGQSVAYPAIFNLIGIPQDPKWHPEGDVFEHTCQAGDLASRYADEAGLAGESKAVIVLGAILHDVGKVNTTVVHPDKSVSSRGHEHTGVPIAQEFLRDIGAPPLVTEQILNIIAEHMTVTLGGDKAPSQRAVRRLVTRLHPATIAQWAMVCEADKMGRGTGGRPSGSHLWLRTFMLETSEE